MSSEHSKSARFALGVAVGVVLFVFLVLVVVLFVCKAPRRGVSRPRRQPKTCYACSGSGGSVSVLAEVAPVVPVASPLSKHKWAAIHARIHPYAIYFPQFHAVKENDTLFYEGMTDTVSLAGYLAAHPHSGLDLDLDTPNLSALQLRHLRDYDCSRPGLVARQAALAAEWGFQGFCIYFYWFAVNTVTRRHQIMDACINTFFDESVALPAGFKVFFDWANEDWTKNAAFGTARDDGVAIVNVYTQEAFSDFTALLVTYFRHDRYLKVDGKPVLFLHHPWFLTAPEMQLLETTLERGCLAAGLAGVHLHVDRVAGSGPEPSPELGFKFRPDYKSGRFRNYEDVITDAITHPDAVNIQTMFFSFNNAARMFKPPKPTRVHAIVATPEQQERLLRACIAPYVNNGRSELQKLFLVNSWNEWGEDMAVEPGKRKGTVFLEMLANAYKQFL